MDGDEYGEAVARLRRLYLNVLRPIAISWWNKSAPVSHEGFWQSWWTETESSDEAAVCRQKAQRHTLKTHHHYAAVESLVTSALVRQRMDPAGATVVDVGSGAGHWLDFWQEAGADTIHAIEVAEAAAEYLQETYDSVDVHQADIADASLDVDADVVSAVGVMFHIVDADDWQQAIENVASMLRPGGLALFTGKLGLLTHDVEHVQSAGVKGTFKRVRSRRAWRRGCRQAGLDVVAIRKSPADIVCETPQNNLLVARKPEGDDDG